MKSENRIKITALVVTVFFLAAMGMMVHHINVNNGLEKDLAGQKLKNEKLLSEKLNLDKQLKAIKGTMTSLQGKNSQLDKYLKEANQKISEREAKINQLNKSNASLANYKKEAENLKGIQNDLNAQIEKLTATNKQLNDQLTEKDNMLTMLTKEHKELTAKYYKMEQEKIFAENFRIESLKKKKDKLTVKASRTKNIMVSFDIPDHIVGKVDESTLKLQLSKPIGTTVQGKQIVTLFDENDGLLYASTESTVTKSPKRAEISFKPEEKLEKGIYTVSIYQNSELVGNAQIRLMK